jgi:hypothetical protein
MTSEPPNKIDLLVDACVRQCLASSTPLAALASTLEVVSLTTILTDAEFDELKRRTLSEVAGPFDTDEPPGTIPLR